MKFLKLMLILLIASMLLISCGEEPVCENHVFSNDCDTDCNTEGCTYTRTVEHKYDNVCDESCNTEGCGYVRSVEHSYDNVCDESCNTKGCGHVRTVEHTYDNSCDASCNTEGCEHKRTVEHVYSYPCDAICDTEGCGHVRNVEHKYDSLCDTDCNNEGCTYTRTTEHVFDNACDASCNNEGCTYTRVNEHSFDNVCDTDCNTVGCTHTRTVPHSFDNDCDKDCNTDGCDFTRETQHADADVNYICDVCTAELDYTLIENGEAKFQIVLASDVSVAIKTIVNGYVSKLSGLGINVTVVSDTENSISECEILIGNVNSRGDAYKYDMHTLGKEGFAIVPIGKKIIVQGGSDIGLNLAVNKFFKDYVGIKSGVSSIENVTVPFAMWYVNPQTGYSVTDVTIDGASIRGYSILAETSVPEVLAAATSLQDKFYGRLGIWLPIKDIEAAHANELNSAIIIKSTSDAVGNGNGFIVYVTEKSLVFEMKYLNRLVEFTEDFFLQHINFKEGVVRFDKSFSFTRDASKIYYSDFGAKGDGVSDDYAAIKAAHDLANTGGQDVFGEAGATYYIKSTMDKDGKYRSISIMTNTDWCGARFIIDDTDVWYGDGGNYSTNIFSITSSLSHPNVTKAQLDAINANGGIGYGTTNIGLTFDYPVMLTLKTSDNKIYIRYGGNANAGSDQHELILVDKDGNIDPSTPLLFEYPRLTSITVERLDETPITVQNATFESLAGKVNLVTEYAYISRGIAISRPNVTVKNLTHIITGEIPKYAVVDKNSNILEGYTCDKNTGKDVRDPSGNPVTDGSAVGFIGHSYNGFINVSNTSNVLIENTEFQARVYYLQGTYDISATNANNLVFKNCEQSNFFYTDASGNEIPNMGSTCWGVAGTNYCKNLVYDGSRLTRYDAHSGVYNGKIINGSEVSSIRLTGGGDMLIENSTLWFHSGSTVISLREDYGSTFKGTVTLRNVEVKSNAGKAPTYLFTGPSANHWFGYTTYFPNIIVDNLKIQNAKSELCLMQNTTFNPNAAFPYRGISIENIHNGDVPFVDGICDKCYNKEAGHDNFCVFVDTDNNLACDNCGKRNPDHVETEHVFVDGNSDKKCDECTKLETKHEHDFTDSKNLNPYTPPEFIKVINNEQNGYTIYVVDYPFWENTVFEGNITKKPAQ